MRRLTRAEITLSGSAFDTVVTCPAGHKLEAIELCLFCVATSGVVYFGFHKLDGSFLFIDVVQLVSGLYVYNRNYEGVPITAGEYFFVVFVGSGFSAASAVVPYVDVSPV